MGSLEGFPIALPIDLESRLLEFLGKIPYAPNKDIQLPLLASIIVEAGSLIDTIFRDNYVSPAVGKKQPKIQDFANHYEQKLKLSILKTLLYQFPPTLLNPFDGWVSKQAGNFSPLSWWTNYNRLKHNRIKEYELATLDTTITILCALQQIIAKIPVFTKALWRHNLILQTTYTPSPYIGQRVEESWIVHHALIETKLFATAIGYEQFSVDIADIDPSRFDSEKLKKFLGKR